MQACMVCMYACVHIGVHWWQDSVSLRGSNEQIELQAKLLNYFLGSNKSNINQSRMETLSYGSVGWKPLIWVCHVLYYLPIETRETSQRSPIRRGVHMYGSTHVHTWVHLHACVLVGLGKLYGLRGSTEVKKRVQDRYSEMDVCD